MIGFDMQQFRHAPLSTVMLFGLANTLIPTAFANTDDGPHTVLDPLVVTASKSPTKTTNLIAQTKVLDKSELARYQGKNLLDVIKSQMGLSHYTSGGSDKVSNFYVRGFDSAGVLVLIDGVRYGSLTTGQPALGLLSANEVERVEIVYGASGSSLHGANAMGGVIQVFTKKGNQDGAKLSVTLGAGSHDAVNYGVSAGFANNSTKVNVSASHTKTDGINTIELPYVSSQRDDDGFKKDSVSLGLSHKFGDRFEVGATGLASKATVHYDNVWSSQSDIRDEQKGGAVSGYGAFYYGNDSSLKLQYGESLDDSVNFVGAINTGEFRSSQKQANLSLIHNLGTYGKVLAGVEQLKQQVKSSTNYTQTKRDNTGAYVGYQNTYGKLDAQAFVRYDDNDWYGKDTNYNAGVAYRVAPNMRVGVNYATGFKAPTFNQLFWPGGGNPNLKPETSKNTELFLEMVGKQHRTRLTGYYSDVKDLITGWPAANINQAKIEGLTLSSDWQFDHYLAGISYDYQEANDVTVVAGNKTKNNLSIRPEHKGTAYLGYAHDDFDVRAEYQQVGDYYINGSPIKGYGLFNISGTYKISPYVMVTTRLNNILNKRYITNESWGTRYNEDGANFYTGITINY